MKDPRFNFYPDNYEGGTQMFTLEQDGAYLRLMLLQFRKGPFTESEAIDLLMQRCRGNAVACAELWKFLMPKFKHIGELFYSERMELEVEKSRAKSKSQSDKALKRWADANAYAVAVPEHMPLKTGTNNRISNNDEWREEQEGGVGETTATTSPASLVSSLYAVLGHLNHLTGFNYNTDASVNRTYILELLQKGFSVDQLKQVIDCKVTEWNHDQKLRVNLKPSVLFGDRFENYFNQAFHNAVPATTSPTRKEQWKP